MINKFEAVGIFVCIGVMAIALFLLRFDSQVTSLSSIDSETQAASVVTLGEGSDDLEQSLSDALTTTGTLQNLIVDDVVVGEGEEVKTGDTVSVHYIGTLQNGQQFDNSYMKATPFSFTVGDGDVIKGWDQGLVGMKEGGQRILVIPAELAYGNKVVGPIPANSTLVFSIELLEIN